MAGTRAQRKPTFLWQALLILLPVVVLAIVGTFSLQQDRLLAQQEAAQRAQAIADDLLPRLWAELSSKTDANGSNRLAFQTDEAGRLIFPPPCEPVPTPQPLNLGELTAEQARLWQAAQTTKRGDLAPAAEALREFIATLPPSNHAAVAHYDLGLLWSRLGKSREACVEFETVRANFPDANGESGLPLRPLAEFKLFELGVTPLRLPTLNSFCSNAVWHPTPLTPYLLGRLRERIQEDSLIPAGEGNDTVERWPESRSRQTNVVQTTGTTGRVQQLWNERMRHEFRQALFVPAVTSWQRTWTEQEQLRQLYHAAEPHLRTPPVVLELQTETGRWLATRVNESPTNRIFVCRREADVAAALKGLIAGTSQMRDYFGIGLELAGETPAWFNSDLRLWSEVYSFNTRTGGNVKRAYSHSLATTALASASKLEDRVEALKVKVYLTSPEMLFKLQRARTFWFGALIAVSAIAALVGLATAWRAFRRQLRLSEMKSNFVSSVSHELRAPIASVRLLAESLERGKISEPAKQNEYFRFIGQECRRLSSLIENVLDFSRIEQGRKQYEFEPTDLAGLVSETVKLMQPYAEEKGVRLETLNFEPRTSNLELEMGTSNIQHPTSTVELNVDGRAIQQALVNLIDNAIKHSPKGETVTVEMEVRSPKPEVRSADTTLNPQPSTLNLSVSDHGPGIPASERERIFERFYRLGSELRRETQGVGIGLSIVKHIVEAHGGRVRVESEVGKGSRFVIELPLSPQRNDE